jgi:hypothetical protein
MDNAPLLSTMQRDDRQLAREKGRPAEDVRERVVGDHGRCGGYLPNMSGELPAEDGVACLWQAAR